MAILKEDMDYYEALLEMFGSLGWKYFLEDHQGALDSLKDSAFMDCPDNNTWQERRGEIKKLTQIISYEPFIRASFDNIEREIELTKTLNEGLH
ncbi:MAG: hypothetical protein E4H40_02825 [Candidatus Brocadiia bacterium]|nr:MAG: hypothetical protein E4H40_02825 [Candidatus Brocadiia bacterium]